MSNNVAFIAVANAAFNPLLSKLQGVNVNLVTINRVSSLHEACLGGHVACAKALLENGAQVSTAPRWQVCLPKCSYYRPKTHDLPDCLPTLGMQGWPHPYPHLRMVRKTFTQSTK